MDLKRPMERRGKGGFGDDSKGGDGRVRGEGMVMLKMLW